MDIQTLTSFFMWCTIINGGMLVLSALIFLFASNFVYRLHSKWFSFSRESFDLVFYAFFGGFKVIFIVFNVVPWIVLVIIG